MNFISRMVLNLLEMTVYKNLAIFWQDYFLGTGKIFLETGKIFLEMARFNFRSLANSKKILPNLS